MSTITGVVLGVLCASAAIWAQTSQIDGVITDSSGLAIQRATIEGTQTATGVVRTVTSGADGGYVLPNLPIGPYSLEVTKEGFSRYVQSGIVLEIDSNRTVDVTLKVGSVSEQVTVEAAALQVRAEAFNLPNHLNPFTPGVGPVAGNFGGLAQLNAPTSGRSRMTSAGMAGCSKAIIAWSSSR
jgi:hypothetical protein